MCSLLFAVGAVGEFRFRRDIFRGRLRCRGAGLFGLLLGVWTLQQAMKAKQEKVWF